MAGSLPFAANMAAAEAALSATNLLLTRIVRKVV
jgi:hypothetical protein